jgi:hypothetical protein
MPHFVCTTCGTQFAESPEPPPGCPICNDDRQYLRNTGQGWTTLDRLLVQHRNAIRLEEPGLIGIGIEPQFAIGQRALLVRTSTGNVLWDCVPLLDPALVEMIAALGGVQAIAISHPHYYSTMVEWSRALGNPPIYLHARDREWVMRPDPAIQFWEGDTHELGPGMTLIRCGGHFDGGTVLHWSDGAEGRGALLTGDIAQVVADRKHVSFMYSYPNFVPLPARAIEHIVSVLQPFSFERIYGAFWDLAILNDGKAALARSAERYIQAIGGDQS